MEEVSDHNAISNRTATNVSVINTRTRCFQKRKKLEDENVMDDVATVALEIIITFQHRTLKKIASQCSDQAKHLSWSITVIM